MKEFNLKLDLPFAENEFDRGIIFTKFLPRAKEAIEVKRGQHNYKIYFSYDRKHLDHVSNDFIKRQKDIKKHINILTNSLRFEITSNIDDKLYESLGNEILNAKTASFCKELMKNILEINAQIYDFTRNIMHQTWIDDYNYTLENFIGFFLSTNAVWNYNGKPKRLYLKGHTQSITVVISSEAEKCYLSKNAWKELQNYISSGNHSKTEQIFIANSIEHLEKGNNRIAILEAVISLEYFIKMNNCENIRVFLPDEEFPYIKKLLLKKGQFSIPLGIILTKLYKKKKITKASKDNILRAVELRNMIMHNAQKKLSNRTVRKCVHSARDFINMLKSKRKIT